MQTSFVHSSIISPSLAVAGEHGKRHVMRAHKPQYVSDWMNPHYLGTIKANINQE